MKITRNGKEYEITEEELTEAYYEQEHNWDVVSVLAHSQEWEEYIPNGTTIEEYAEELAYETRYNVNKYDMEGYYGYYAYKEALHDILNIE